MSCLNSWEHYKKPRYYRDHLTLLRQLTLEFSLPTLDQAMLYCSERELYSINDLKSAAEHLGQEVPEIEPTLLGIQLSALR